MHRFFVPPEWIRGERVNITGRSPSSDLMGAEADGGDSGRCGYSLRGGGAGGIEWSYSVLAGCPHISASAWRGSSPSKRTR